MRINSTTGLIDPNGSTNVELGDAFRYGWNPYDEFLPGQFVERNGRLYECLLANTGVEPITTDTTWWTQPFPGTIQPTPTPSYPPALPPVQIFVPTWFQYVGADGGNPVALVAGESLGGQRVVAIGPGGTVIYANAQLDHSKKVIGVTTKSVNSGETVTVQTSGVMVDSGWTFTPGATLYLGINSLLSATPPTTGFVKVMGIAVAATEIVLQMQSSIVL